MNPPKYSRLCTTFAGLVLSSAVCLNATPAELSAAVVQASQSLSAKPQSAELVEAVELSSKVLELYAEQKFKEALPLAIRALEIREKALSGNHELVINAQINLAEVYMALGKFSAAEAPLQRAVKTIRSANHNDLRLADILERTAFLYYSLGDVGKVELDYEESLRIRENSFGVESTKTAQALMLLAEFHRIQGNDEKAATFYKRLISVREKEAGGDEQLVDAIERYVCLLGKLDKNEEAERWSARLASLQSKNSAGGLPVQGGSHSEKFVKGGILNGKAISLPGPQYPPEARKDRVSGRVVVQVWIDKSGRVLRTCAVEGPAQLRRVSELAAYRATFAPTRIDGKPAQVTGVLVYNYVYRF